MAGEVRAGQQQHPRAQGAQQPAGQLVLTCLADPVEHRVDHGVGTALDQREQPQLRVTALSDAERLGVGRGVGRIQAGSVPGSQPEPERKRTRRPRHRQRSAPQAE
jgi:hypothetical protein